mgnify:CR=1 FL=1
MAPQIAYLKTFSFPISNKKENKCERIKNNMLSCLRNPLDKTNCMNLIEIYYLKCKTKPPQKK